MLLCNNFWNDLFCPNTLDISVKSIETENFITNVKTNSTTLSSLPPILKVHVSTALCVTFSLLWNKLPWKQWLKTMQTILFITFFAENQKCI